MEAFESAVRIADAVRAGERTAEEVVTAFAERAARLGGDGAGLGAFLHIDSEGAVDAARAVDEKRAAGEPLGPLAGVPVAIKDNLCVKGLPTTCASRILEGYVPPYDADVIERLRTADAVVLGKTNMDEFAMGSSNENSAFFVARNPYDRDRAPGGSSGGSAVAASAGLAPIALGSDTGGSVRQPGAFCGVTAVKPTYGRVSRYGLIAFASSLDQVGPFSRDVRSSARALGVLAGHDARDATSATAGVADYEAATVDASVSGLRVGVVRAELEQVDDADVKARCDAVLSLLSDAGAELVDVALPHAEHAVSVYYLVATAEASSNLARFDGMRFGLRADGGGLIGTYEQTRAQGFGPEVKRRIMLGTYALSTGYYDDYYLKAQRVRTLIARDYQTAFESCDVVFSPTSPTPAFSLGEKVDDPLAMYLADVFTLPPSLAGLPAISTPAGFGDASGLPVGVQFTGRAFDEVTCFRAAAAVEAALGPLRPPSV